VQTDLLEVLSQQQQQQDQQETKGNTTVDVWGLTNPIQIGFVVTKANYSTWLFLLCLCHHIPSFEQIIFTTTHSYQQH
jgi:hypothetical protein